MPAETGLFRASTGEVKAVDGTPRTFRFCFSDGNVDRIGDTINPAGWDLHDFEKNPVALWAHDSSSPPIGRAKNLMVENDRLMGDIEFAPADIYPFAETIYRMVAGGWLNAVSVGFLPTDYDWADDEDREWGIDFLRQQLLEISVVPVPALPSALIDARAKGIDTRPILEWAERTLDGGGKIIIPKAELERLRKAAKEPTMARTMRVPRLRSDDGMSETDPAAAGACVGNCGRPIDQECGMKNVAECAIHGQGEVGLDDGTDDKKLAALIAKTVRTEVTKALKGLTKPRRRSEGESTPGEDENPEGEGRPDLSPDAEKCIRMAHLHMKAMGDALDVADDHYERAMDNLELVKEALDATPPSDDGLGEGSDPEAEKAARLARARSLRARAGV